MPSQAETIVRKLGEQRGPTEFSNELMKSVRKYRRKGVVPKALDEVVLYDGQIRMNADQRLEKASSHSGFAYDSETNIVVRNGKETHLGIPEGKILVLLLENMGRIVEYKKFESVWEDKNVNLRSVLRRHISTIRDALEPDKKEGEFELLLNERGKGYKLVDLMQTENPNPLLTVVQLVESLERTAELARASGNSKLSKDLIRVANRHKGLNPLREEDVVFDRTLESNKAKKPLMPNERRLISVLKGKPNEVMSEAELHERIYGQKYSRGSVKKLVSRTRSKIEDDPKNPKNIITEYGEGYLWRDRRYFNSELAYDPDRFDLTVEDIHFILGERQRAVFGLLVKNAGSVVTHEMLSEEVWGGLEYDRDLVVQVIVRLQRRVKNATQKKLKSIVSVPGVGYKLVDPERNKQKVSEASTVYVASDKLGVIIPS